MKANSFLYTYYRQFQHLYIDPNSHLIQYYTPNSRIFEEIFIKNQPSISQTRICLPLNSFMLLLIKLILMVTPVKNTLLKHLTNFNTFLTFLYGSRFSSMIVLNVKQINIFLLNPKIILLLYHFMKTPLILITEYQWILKVPFFLLLIIYHIFLLSLMLSATLLLLTQLLTLLLNMHFKLFFIIGLQNLDPHNISLLTEVRNI